MPRNHPTQLQQLTDIDILEYGSGNLASSGEEQKEFVSRCERDFMGFKGDDVNAEIQYQWPPRPPIDQNKRKCGPYATPYDAFTAIWDRRIMEHIANETNRYARDMIAAMSRDQKIITDYNRLLQWKDTDVSELYVYFAIILGTGIPVKRSWRDYWLQEGPDDPLATLVYADVMSSERFHLLSLFLHFNNNELCKCETMSKSEVNLFKVRFILDHLNDKFSKLYNLSQNLSLDASNSLETNSLKNNRFVPNKAARGAIGNTTYELCEPETGYLWRCEVLTDRDYSSSAQERSPISGIVPTLVLKILQGLEYRGHTIWMDQFFNSPALARELKSRGFDCAGLLRTNRQFVPVEIKNLKEEDMVVGQIYGCTSGDMDIILWRDKFRMAFISTYHGPWTTKCGDTLKPSIVPDYNFYKGLIDRKDALLATFPVKCKGRDLWYKKFFKRLLNASVLNAQILYKGRNSISHEKFRVTLVDQLMDKHKQTTST